MRRLKESRICCLCRTEYHPSGRHQRYCSRACFFVDHSGEKHHAFKGGNISPLGYRRISVQGRLVHEHRHVMEQILGRRLKPSEIVHHLDGDKLNNSPDNLTLLPSQTAHVLEHYTRFRSETHKECTGCGQIKERAAFYRSTAKGRDRNYPMCKECMRPRYPHSRYKH